MNYIIELADLNDINIILDLYKERIKWFKDNNIRQWSKYLINHPKSEFEELINNKNYYILKSNDKIIAGFVISDNNKEWNDNNHSAYYISKVVTKVGYKNVGIYIFKECKKIAKRDGKKYLRLNCIKSNEKLNNIYEMHNFKLIRHGSNERYTYSLREYKIDE